MKKIKKTPESNVILIMNILSVILLLALPVFLYYDFRGLHNEWKNHLDNGDIYMGSGEWFPTKIMICSDNSYFDCPKSCVICPPCEACSSVSCQTEEFCKNIGFNKSWYEEVSNK